MRLFELIVGRQTADAARERLAAEIIGLMCGYIAGLIAQGGYSANEGTASAVMSSVAKKALDDPGALRPEEDIIRSGIVAQQLVGPDRARVERFIDSAAERTEKLVRSLWQPIAATAAALSVRGELSGDDFRAIVRPWAETGILGPYPYRFTDSEFERHSMTLRTAGPRS